jgi:hypothetical protein
MTLDCLPIPDDRGIVAETSGKKPNQDIVDLIYKSQTSTVSGWDSQEIETYGLQRQALILLR